MSLPSLIVPVTVAVMLMGTALLFSMQAGVETICAVDSSDSIVIGIL